MASNRPTRAIGGTIPGPDVKPVKLWEWPKVVFLYPTMLVAAIAALGTAQWEERAATWGVLFLVVFFVNIVIIAFDFPRTASLSLLLLVVALILGGVLLNDRFDFFPALRALTERVSPRANSQFYSFIAGGLAFVYLVVLIIDFRFDYWVVYPNESSPRRGILGNVSRYPAPNLQFYKEIDDVFEFFLFGSGRIMIQPTHGPPIVLENVHRVNHKAKQIQELVDALNVEITQPDPV